MAHEEDSVSAAADHPELIRRAALLAELDLAVDEFLGLAAAAASADVARDDAWTVRDVVGHVAFWHESLARNVDDLVQGRRPTPLRGRLSDLNEAGLVQARAMPLDANVDRVRVAHAKLRGAIISPALGSIPYRIGSRRYTPCEHLELVRDHVRTHARSLERASDPRRARTTRSVRDVEGGL